MRQIKNDMRLFSILASFLILLSACNSGGSSDGTGDSSDSTQAMQGETMTMPSGVEITIAQAGDGIRPQLGQKVTVSYTGMLSDGTIFDQSQPEKPMQFVLGSGQGIPGWHEGIAQLSKGAVATIVIPSDQGFGEQGLGGLIPPNEIITFDVEILYVVDGPKPIVHELFDTEGKEVMTTNSGLQYVIIEEGTGQQAVAGMTVQVHYHGALEDGTKFDSSFDRGEPIEFQLGAGRVIPGWEEGIALLKEGAKAQLIIPPYLAYGEQGAPGVIPPNSTLIFDVQLMGVLN